MHSGQYRGIWKNFGVLSGGMASAQAIGLLFSPLLSRLYTPEDFGVYQVYLSILMILGTCVNMRFDEAIILPKSEVQAGNLLILSLTVTLFSVALISTFVILLEFSCSSNIRILPAKYLYSKYFWFVPISLMLNSCFNSFSQWLNRQRNFRLMSIGYLSQGIAATITQATIGIASPSGAIGLILGHVTGFIIGVTIFGLIIFRSNWETLKNAFRINDMLFAAKQYIKFVQFGFPSSIINAFSQNIIALAFPMLFGATSLGYYSLASRSVLAPASVITQSFRSIFYQKAATLYVGRENLHSFVTWAYTKLFLLSVIPAIVLIFWGPTIFELFFGSGWRTAGEWSRLLVPWFVAMFLVSPTTTILLVLGRQDILFYYDLILLLLRLSAIAFGAYVMCNVWWVIVLFSAVGFAANCFLGARILREASRAHVQNFP